MATALQYKGKPAVQVVVADITDRTHAAEEIRLHRDRLAKLSRRLVQAHETESRAIGRELHDQFGQILTALKLTLDIIPQLPAEQVAKKLAVARELVDDLMERVRHLSLELRPSMLDDLGLIPALLWHVNRYQEQTGIEVDFKHSGAESKRFDPEIETTAYRLIQEALTNVARHARGTRVGLQLRVNTTPYEASLMGTGESGRMEIQIEDNGRGFDPQQALDGRRSSGLSGMRERAGLLNGEFKIESRMGAGTRIFIELPLQENPA
jgi:signal transduction histidine kinase